MATKKYIAGLDVGTTTVRCVIFDTEVNVIGKAEDQIQLLYPKPGYVEIDPNGLWQSIVETIKNAINNAQLTPADITCIGVSTQRNSFITWDRITGKPFHNFITWKDLRASKLVKKWNKSFALSAIRFGSSLMHFMTKNQRYLGGKMLKLTNSQVLVRLAWCLKHNRPLREAMEDRRALYGTMDSWILYRLRQGLNATRPVEHISDITNCACSAFYDPFQLDWAGWALKLFGISRDMLPRVVDNSYDFGHVDASIFGAPIKIACSIADQSASMWGSCCFKTGDVKITLGTGAFLNLNSGGECHASVHGLYPLVAWRRGDEVVYCIEGASNDNGSIIRWAMEAELFTDAKSSAELAFSVPSSDGVCFVPSFSGLGPPINDDKAATGFIGIHAATRKPHLVRAVLESLVFRIAQLHACTCDETNFKITTIRVDGGVSRNNFVCQTLADLTGLGVERAQCADMTVLGCCYLAGLNEGIWRSTDELTQLRRIDRVFQPRPEQRERLRATMQRWEKAAKRFGRWYDAKEVNALVLDKQKGGGL